MYISDDDKRQIMRELAQGDVLSLPETTASLAKDDQDFVPQNYENFDNFAQRSTWQAQDQDSLVQAFLKQLNKRGLAGPN